MQKKVRVWFKTNVKKLQKTFCSDGASGEVEGLFLVKGKGRDLLWRHHQLLKGSRLYSNAIFIPFLIQDCGKICSPTGGMRTTKFWSSTPRKMKRSEAIKSATCHSHSLVCQTMRWDLKEEIWLFVMFLQASIRAPVGATFVPRTAHLKLIKPRIKTRAGEVIEPMSRYLIPEMIHMNINFFIWKHTNIPL